MPTPPKWMQSFDSISPAAAAGIGAFLSGGNPKTFIFSIAAAASIAEADLSAALEIVALIVFIVLVSAAVAGLVIWYLVTGAEADTKLRGLSGWLTQNNTVIMGAILLIVGVSQFGQGISGLFV